MLTHATIAHLSAGFNLWYVKFTDTQSKRVRNKEESGVYDFHFHCMCELAWVWVAVESPGEFEPHDDEVGRGGKGDTSAGLSLLGLGLEVKSKLDLASLVSFADGSDMAGGTLNVESSHEGTVRSSRI